MNGTLLLKALLDLGRDALLGTVLGVAGLVLGYYFYLKGKTFKRMYVAHAGVQIVGVRAGSGWKDITIQYRGNDVPQVTLTRVAIWNGGKDTIRSNDVVKGDPITIHVQEGGILEAQIFRESRAQNGCSIDTKPGYDQCFVSFDYLDPDDGVVIQLLHTSARATPRVTGTVMGMKSGLESAGEDDDLLYTRAPAQGKASLAARFGNVAFPIAFMLAAAYFLVKALFFPKGLDGGPDQPIAWGGALPMAIFLGVMLWMYWRQRKWVNLPSSLRP